MCATSVIEKEHRERAPGAIARIIERVQRIPELQESIHPTGPGNYGEVGRGILALVKPKRLRRILSRMLYENKFLGPYGIRSISKFHQQNPYLFHVGGQE